MIKFNICFWFYKNSFNSKNKSLYISNLTNFMCCLYYPKDKIFDMKIKNIVLDTVNGRVI